MEKITISPDGSIPEVKMTSQGVGDPFAPGETIFGYQACGVTGSCYIGLGGPYTEQLMHISDGDTAVFRYVRSDRPYTEIALEAEGTGEIEILLNGQRTGIVAVTDGEQAARTVEAPAGEYELTLRFVKAEELTIRKLTLF